MKQYLHDYDAMLECAMHRVNEEKMSEGSRRDILRFLAHLQARGLSKPRVLRYTYVLRQAARLLGKPFQAAKRADIEKVVAAVENADYTEWTKASFRIAVKKFYKWLSGGEEKTPPTYPPQVAWIRTNVPRDRIPRPKPSELVTEEEVKRLLDACHHPRDQAFIALLWDSGGRIGEIGTLRLRDITSDRYGLKIQVHGKTGAREVLVILATPYLSRWLDVHPRKKEPESPLWVSTSNANRARPLGYAALRKILRLAFQRAGLKKRNNPHSFRHARATYLASRLTEFQMNQRFGWAQGSDMPGTYVHLSGRDTDAAMLRLHGIVPEEANQPAALQPRLCPRCNTINATDSAFCRKCGGALDLGPALQAEQDKEQNEEILALVLKDEDVQKVVHEALLKLKLKSDANGSSSAKGGP